MAGWNSALILPPPPKAAAPSKPPGRNIGPTKAGIGPLPLPRAAPAPNTFRGIPHTFEGAPRLQRAAAPVLRPMPAAPPRSYAAPPRVTGAVRAPLVTRGAANAGLAKGPPIPAAKGAVNAGLKPTPQAGGLGDVLGSILKYGAATIAHTPAGAALGIGGEKVIHNVAEHALGVTKAVAKEPGPVISKTAASLPQIANSLAMMGVRGGEEGALALGKQFGGGALVPHGVGEPGKAAGEFAKSAVKSTAKIVGENQKAVEDEVKKEGVANQALTYLPFAGFGGAAAGKVLTAGVRATDYGGVELRALNAAREARRIAAQASVEHPEVADQIAAQVIAHNPDAMAFLRQDGAHLVPRRAPASRIKAYVRESAGPGRPPLRQAPGNLPPAVRPGAPVRVQPRSENLFRGLGQTALDDARRAYQMKGLQRTARERLTQLTMHPEMHGDSVALSYPQHLATLTRQGEVTPLFQKGGVAGGLSRFAGATKAQRVGVAETGSDIRRLGEHARALVHNTTAMEMKDLTPEQRRIFDDAKEGKIPLHDPALAHYWLQEIQRAANAGSNEGKIIPLMHRMFARSDVARNLEPVLAKMEKEGPASVITPEFAKAIERVPDERAVSPHDPILQQMPDEVAVRKYAPQQETLADWARHQLTLPNPHRDAYTTLEAVKQMWQKIEQGKDLRGAAIGAERGAPKPSLLATTEEAQRLENAERELAAAEGRLRYAQSSQRVAEGKARHVPGAVARAQDDIKAAKAERKDATNALHELAGDPGRLHELANEKLGDAKNLADENAKRHGMPTDRAYIPHRRARGAERYLHTVGQRMPPKEKPTKYWLQSHGYMSRDPRLNEDAMLKSIRHILASENITQFDAANRYPGLPKGLTSDEMRQEAERRGIDIGQGRGPGAYEVANLGEIFRGLADRQRGGADLHSLDRDPADHARAIGEMLQDVRGVHPADRAKGAQIYPRAALDELQSNLGRPAFYMRGYGQLKGRYSSLMLGSSPAWATTMSLLTYPSQALMGGMNVLDFPSVVKWYRGLTEAEKTNMDIQLGTDSPFRSSHEGRAERMGSATPGQSARAGHLGEILETMRIWRESPMGKLLHDSRPDRIVMALERVPRRYARIAVAAKHIKGMALERMLAEAKGLEASQSKLELQMAKLEHVGRMPSDRYMRQVMESKPAMEEVARRTQTMLGEWQHMTAFERNSLSKIILFYPWVRYSLRLAFRSLPSNHPLLYSLAGQLGVMSREQLRTLLGTDTPIGKAPLGRAQPEVEPQERHFMWAGAAQVDPLLNVLTDLLGGKPSQLIGIPPPFISAPLEYAVNRNSFSDKPLKKSEPYVKGEQKEEHRPDFWPYMVNKVLLQPFAPGRAAQKLTAGGRPQGEESLLGNKPMHYSGKLERRIEEENEEAKERQGVHDQIAQYVLPLLPHFDRAADEAIRTKLETEKKQQKKEEREKESSSSAAGTGL